MNKKLTTILLAVLIILIGKVDAATLTQKIGDGYIRSTVVEGQEVTIKFVSPKYTFSSWTVETENINIDLTNPIATFTMPSSNVVIKANYEGATEYYTISYNANGGSGTMSSQTVESGQQIALSANTFTRSGYTFLGWSTSSSATTATYIYGQSITPTGNMTLYAVWSVLYNCACSGCSNTVSASGLWCDSCTAAGICSGCSKCVTHNTALCTTCNLCTTCCTCTKYTLTYNANNGSGAPASQTGTTLTISSTTPTRSGWNFVGWGTSSSATSASYQAGDSITLTADKTIYAIWSHTLTLTYNANGGSGAPSSQSQTTTSSSYSFTISTTEPTPPSGKAFRGWSTTSSDTTADYKIGASISISSNTTLYAVYVTPLSSGDSFTGSDVGAYVTYTPSSTSYTVSTTASGYTSDQTYNPSNYTNWRVFSNDGTNVEIISDESVGTLYLRGSTGYINAVQTLQDMSAAYVNSTYATSARSLGYSEEGLTDVANYKTIDTTTYPLEYGIDDTAFPYYDTQYTTDRTVISNNGSLKQKSGYVWLASRYAGTYTSYSYSYFYVSSMYTSGTVSNYSLYHVFSSGSVNSYTFSNGVRPVVSLKSGLVISGGDGSPSNPYTIIVE